MGYEDILINLKWHRTSKILKKKKKTCPQRVNTLTLLSEWMNLEGTVWEDWRRSDKTSISRLTGIEAAELYRVGHRRQHLYAKNGDETGM